MSRRHRLHMTFLKSGQDYDWRTAPQGAQSREKQHARAARIYIDNQDVDAVKLAVKKVKSVSTAPAQPNAMAGPRPRLAEGSRRNPHLHPPAG